MGLMSLVTPPATNSRPSGSVTNDGYQRPWFMGAAVIHVSVAAWNRRTARMPSSSTNPFCVAGNDGSL